MIGQCGKLSGYNRAVHIGFETSCFSTMNTSGENGMDLLTGAFLGGGIV